MLSHSSETNSRIVVHPQVNDLQCSYELVVGCETPRGVLCIALESHSPRGTYLPCLLDGMHLAFSGLTRGSHAVEVSDIDALGDIERSEASEAPIPGRHRRESGLLLTSFVLSPTLCIYSSWVRPFVTPLLLLTDHEHVCGCTTVYFAHRAGECSCSS